MKRTLSYAFVCVCAVSVIILSCEKEIPGNPDVGNADTIAVFALTFADDGCVIPPISGAYIQGIPQTADAGFAVEVRVATLGSYKLTTDTLNGYWFSATGSFTDTGLQTVSLQASGTPVSPGLNYFTLIARGVKRLIPLAVLKPDPQQEVVPFESYFKATIGGVAYNIPAPTTGPDNITYSSGDHDTASFVSYIGSGIYPSPPGTGALSLQKGLLYHYYTSTEAQFKAFFQPGSYPFYLNKCDINELPGIIVFWSDDKGDLWTSIKRLGNQDGSSFQIVGEEDGHDNKGLYYVKIRARFNCKLYNPLTGEMKELVDGEVVSYYKK